MSRAGRGRGIEGENVVVEVMPSREQRLRRPGVRAAPRGHARGS